MTTKMDVKHLLKGGVCLTLLLLLVQPGHAQQASATKKVSTKKEKTLTAGAPGDMPLPSAIVAHAGKLKLTVGEYYGALGQRLRSMPPEQLQDPKLRKEFQQSIITSLLTNQALQAQDKARLASMHPETDPGYQVAARLNGLYAQAAAALQQESKRSLDEKALSEAYAAQMKERGRQEQTISFRYIFLKTVGLKPEQVAEKRKKAAKAAARIKAGEDFTKVMNETSEAQDRSVAPIRLTPGSPDFNEKLYKRLQGQKPGVCSDVVDNKAGLFIFLKLPAEKLPPVKSLKETLADPQEKGRLQEYARSLPGQASPMESLYNRIEKQYPRTALYKPAADAKELPADATVLVQVKDEKLTMHDVRNWMSFYNQPPTPLLLGRILPEVEHCFVLASYARDQKLSLPADSPEQQKSRANLERMFLANAERKSIPAPTEAQERAYYEKNKEMMRQAEKVTVERLLVTADPAKGKDVSGLIVQNEAEKLQASLNKGEKVEAALKAQDSKSPVRVERKSYKEVDMQELMRQEPRFPTTLVQGEVGKFGTPVQLEKGFAVYGLTAKTRGALRPFAEVKSGIERQLLQEKMQEKQKSANEKIGKEIKAKLQVDEKLAEIPKMFLTPPPGASMMMPPSKKMAPTKK